MPVYRVSGTVTVSAWTLVEADTPEEARRMAMEREGALAPYGWDRSGVSPAESAVIENGDGSLEPRDVEEASPKMVQAFREMAEEE